MIQDSFPIQQDTGVCFSLRICQMRSFFVSVSIIVWGMCEKFGEKSAVYISCVAFGESFIPVSRIHHNIVTYGVLSLSGIFIFSSLIRLYVTIRFSHTCSPPNPPLRPISTSKSKKKRAANFTLIRYDEKLIFVKMTPMWRTVCHRVLQSF